MASTSEVGHAKNVAHFSQLITYCVSYGTSYNPSNTAIKITALNTVLANAQTILTAVINDLTSNSSAINARLIAFKDIKKMSTRMYAALSGSGATTQQKANAKTINRKIQGSRAKITPPPAPDPNTTPSPTPAASNQKTISPPPNIQPVTPPTPPHTISTAQLSYDNLIQHFQAFIALLQSVTTYNPNETDLKITALNTYLTNLNTTNNTAVTAQTKLNNTRITRNKTLYTPGTGLCYIGEETKDYIKSIYGSTAPEYKQVRKLNFKLIKP